MEFYERISGARMHTAMYKPTLIGKFIDNTMLLDMLDYSQNCIITINEIHNVLSNNKI
jgi:NADH:ubiquinone oxidoreductase subunit D